MSALSDNQKPRRPRTKAGEGLRLHHVDAVREVLTQNPALSLRKLAPLVAQRCAIPHVSDHTLHLFLALHGIPRVVPPWALKRSERLRARGAVLLSAPLLADPADRARDERKAKRAAMRAVSDEHKAIAASNASIFSLGGFAPALPVDGASQAVLMARQRHADLLQLRRADAHRLATGWLATDSLARLACAALDGALSYSQREPDPEDYDPESPESWFDPVCFAEDVADLFRLAVFEMASRAGIEAARHERNRLLDLGGAAVVLGACNEAQSTKPGLGWSPREPAESCGNT